MLKKLFIVTICFVVSSCASSRYEPQSYYETDEFFEYIYDKLDYTPRQKALIAAGKKQIGTRYVLGGQSPDKGFDCSGFTRYIYKDALGVSLPRTAREQNKAGTYVAREYLLPGDLVFLDLQGDLSHVGVYIGEGQFFHASTSKNRLMVANMNGPYYAKRYDSAVRVTKY